MTLYANIYGNLIPVDHVVEYGEHEVSIANGPFERIRYARVFIARGFQIELTVDLRDLFVAA